MNDFVAMPRQSPTGIQSQRHPPATPLAELADTLVHRIFGVGLALQSAANLADGTVAERLNRTLDELDAIIREVRTATFREASQSPRLRAVLSLRAIGPGACGVAQ